MRIAIVLTLLIVLTSLAACNGTSVGNPEIMPPWPPDRPVQQQPPEVDQDTIDWLKFILSQPSYVDWRNGGISRDVLWGGISAIYSEAVEEEDSYWMGIAITSMGMTGYIEFLPYMLEALENPVVARDKPGTLNAIGHMPSDYSVFVLTNYCNDEREDIRERAASELGRFNYYDLFPGTRMQAIIALVQQRKVEQADWVLNKIDWAIEVLLRRYS